MGGGGPEAPADKRARQLSAEDQEAMSDVVERAKELLERNEDVRCGCCGTELFGPEGCWQVLPGLVAEVERLHSWDGLMSLLDEHYPEDIFPTMPDTPNRDPGPRIISLLRHLAASKSETCVRLRFPLLPVGPLPDDPDRLT